MGKLVLNRSGWGWSILRKPRLLANIHRISVNNIETGSRVFCSWFSTSRLVCVGAMLWIAEIAFADTKSSRSILTACLGWRFDRYLCQIAKLVLNRSGWGWSHDVGRCFRHTTQVERLLDYRSFAQNLEKTSTFGEYPSNIQYSKFI